MDSKVPNGPGTLMSQQDMPGEALFGNVGKTIAENGWSIYPQEPYGDRLPARLNYRVIKVSEDYQLATKLPTPEFIDACVKQCSGMNVACVLGPASANAVVIDIDVTDPEQSIAIQKMAFEVFGITPFRRVGRAPKMALFYRHQDDDPIDSTSRFFSKKNDEGKTVKSGQGVEILSTGKSVTLYGRHHKTGRHFVWMGELDPITASPSAAPIITAEQVNDFLVKVDNEFPFHKGGDASTTFVHTTDSSGKRVFKPAKPGAGTEWVEDDEGIVIDGRDPYLKALVTSACRSHVNEILSQEKNIYDIICSEVIDSFISTTKRETGGRWQGAQLKKEVSSRVRRLISKVLDGKITFRANSGKSYIASQDIIPSLNDDIYDLSFLRPVKMRKQLISTMKVGEPVPPEDNALIEDRSLVTDDIQKGITSALTAFLSDVYGSAEGVAYECRQTRIHILKAPTGAGKTSQTVRRLAMDPRTYIPYNPDQQHDRDEDNSAPMRPWVMLLPTYSNIEELRARAQVLNLDGSLPDEALTLQAKEFGLLHEDDPALSARLTELRRDAENCGVKTMVYAGKVKAGCMLPEKVEMVSQAGLGTASLCKTTKKNQDGEAEEIKCEFYDTCPAIKQRDEIQKSHIIFTPHSFLAMPIPEELHDVRGIVADERVHHLFLHTTTLHTTTLTTPRKRPRLTKKLKDQGVTPEDLLADRDKIASITLDAMKSGECPAQAILNHPLNIPGRESEGALPLVESALAVMRSATQRDITITPMSSEEDLLELCSRPTGKEIHEELRFWKIVEERVHQLIQDRLKNEGIRKLEAEITKYIALGWSPALIHSLKQRLAHQKSIPNAAKGHKDYRLQLLSGNSGASDGSDLIRLSWRSKPNWSGVPFLLLDASASPEIIRKIWGGSDARIVSHDVVQDVGRSLNVRIVGIVNETNSTSSFIGGVDGSEQKRVSQAKRLDRTRKAISAVSSLYGMGRIVVGTNIALRRAINSGWVCPDNVDWCHFGAMRGLDMFKFHAAALSVGRMEPPTRAIDGLAAALTYDDETPERPYDSRGDGLDAEGAPLQPPMGEQRIRHRSGDVRIMQVPRYPSPWAAMIQKQYREEELLQFLGRLRPVYREGQPPVWYAMSSIIPEGLIVDDIIHVNDFILSRQCNHLPSKLWDAVRRTGGIAVPEVLYEVCPDIFKSVEDARNVMRRMKFGDPSKPERETQGFNIWQWRALNGSDRLAYVRGSVPNQEEFLKERMSRLMMPGSDLKMLHNAVSGLNLLSKPREPDNVDAQIGSRNERIAEECQDIDTAGIRLMDAEGEMTILDGERLFPWGRSDKPGNPYLQVTMSEMKALISLERTRNQIAAAKTTQ